MLKRDNIQAHQGLAATLFRKGDYAGAIRAYQTLLTVDPRNWQAYSAMGMAFLKQENISKCLRSAATGGDVSPE